MTIETFEPGEFSAANHFYPRTLNAQIHPLVSNLFRMSTERLVSRYCHLHPHTDAEVLTEILTTAPRFLLWSGSDILNVSTDEGKRLKLVLETNSCPSGQKSFPLLDEEQDEGGYRTLMEKTFFPQIVKKLKGAATDGVLVVLYDKNRMEATGYAQVLANLSGQQTYAVPCMASNPEEHLAIRERELYLRLEGRLLPVACAFRYVTQRPWASLPFNLKTPILNPIVACLAGGRNKTSAAKAYEVFNGHFRRFGLEIETPATFTNTRLEEVPLLLERLGGRAVVKVPYLNAGQGIFTIVDEEELKTFMNQAHRYDEFVVQQLVGNFRWSSTTGKGKVFNIGTIPNKKGAIYVFDLRVMISWQVDAYRPVAMYARRAPRPMTSELEPGMSSWEILGTNLSRKAGPEEWVTEPNRLLMMDRVDFGRLGLGLDDLIGAFVQAVFANRAIDDLASRLVKRGGGFRHELFRSLNNDSKLLREIRVDSKRKD